MIWAAAVTGAFGLLGVLVQRGVRRNSAEHAENAGRLDAVLTATGRIEQKLDDHLENHREGRT